MRLDPRPQGGRVYNSAAQSIGDSSLTALSFDSVAAFTDAGGVFSGTKYIAKKAGFRGVVGRASFVANATGNRKIRIRKNGASTIADAGNPVSSGSFTSDLVVVTFSCWLSVGDYIELCAFQTSGGSLSVNAGDGTINLEVVEL